MPTSTAADAEHRGAGLPYAARGYRASAWLAAVLAVVVVVALVAAMVLTGRTVVSSAAGLGDPYYPGAGGPGYDVGSYDLDLRFDPATGHLDGIATVTLRPTVDLAAIHLDLALPVTGVRLGGRNLPYEQRGDDLAVRPASLGVRPSFARGVELSLVVAYGGRPADVPLGGEGSVYTHGDETLIAGEPQGAAAWYPANDHPSDPARFAATITVPSGYQAISVGRLVSQAPGPAGDVWRWQTDEPTVTYATMLAVGHYDMAVENVTVGGAQRQAVYAVSRQADKPDQAMAWLRRSAAAAETLTRWLGPYPLSSIGGLVPSAKPWWGGLETLGRPIYHPSLVGSDSVIYHELAHMWLGDTVTLERWGDLFINESLATYAEWLAMESTGRQGPQTFFDSWYAGSPDSFWRQRLSDPGPGRQLFTRVYDRGAMAVHATRVRMGDESFFAFFKAWAQQRGPRSLEQWRSEAQAASHTDLGPLFAAWLDGTTRVPNRPELGFR